MKMTDLTVKYYRK